MRNTPGDSLRAVQDRDPSTAELAEDWAHTLLREAGGMHAAASVSAAQVHAMLAISARLGELTSAIRTSGATLESVRCELTAIRCESLLELTQAIESIGWTGAAS